MLGSYPIADNTVGVFQGLANRVSSIRDYASYKVLVLYEDQSDHLLQAKDLKIIYKTYSAIADVAEAISLQKEIREP